MPVLLGPVLDGLEVKKDGCYVDGTFGRGGHSSAILEQLNADGRLIAFDRDPQAIASANMALTSDPRVTLIRGEIASLATCMGERGLTGQVDGLLLDLGVSSPQLDEAERGFSFLREGLGRLNPRIFLPNFLARSNRWKALFYRGFRE